MVTKVRNYIVEDHFWGFLDNSQKTKTDGNKSNDKYWNYGEGDGKIIILSQICLIVHSIWKEIQDRIKILS